MTFDLRDPLPFLGRRWTPGGQFLGRRRCRSVMKPLEALTAHSIQLTPLRVSGIAVNRCHRLPTTAQSLPKSPIWIKKSRVRESNCCQRLPPVTTVSAPVRTTNLVAQMTCHLSTKPLPPKPKARNQYRTRVRQGAHEAMHATPPRKPLGGGARSSTYGLWHCLTDAIDAYPKDQGAAGVRQAVARSSSTQPRS